MVVISPVVIPFNQGLALRQITIQMTRDGEQTPDQKILRIMLPGDLTLLAAFSPANGYSSTQKFLASAVDGERLLLAQDKVTPKRTASRITVLSEDVTISLDLNDGSGGGAGGTPATLAALVKVDSLLAERDVVAVEQQPDGAWRVAGSGRTDAQGELAIELRVTPSSLLYALALDNWGIPYQADLPVAVGTVVRPSQFVGWLYRVTEAGLLPGIEPEWWAADGDNASRPLGTARAVAVRYYQPVGHGPLLAELS